MNAIRIHKIIEKDGEIVLRDLPCRKGEEVELILLTEPSSASTRPRLTAGRLISSELVGLWKGRKDIGDSAAYARQLREQAQER